MRVIIILMLGILIAIPSVVGFGQITGYFGSTYETEDIVIDIEIGEPVEFEYDLFEDGKIVSSLSLYGTVEGNGKVKVLAEDVEGNRFVVMNYQHREKTGFAHILTTFISGVDQSLTGAVVDSGSSDPGKSIDSACVDTCTLRGEFKGNKLKLLVEIEPGTTFNLHKINYGAYSPAGASEPQKSVFARLWARIFG